MEGAKTNSLLSSFHFLRRILIISWVQWKVTQYRKTEDALPCPSRLLFSTTSRQKNEKQGCKILSSGQVNPETNACSEPKCSDRLLKACHMLSRFLEGVIGSCVCRLAIGLPCL